MSRIESSAEKVVGEEFTDLIRGGEPILVSGQPLRIFHPTDSKQDKFLEECQPLDEEHLQPPFSLFQQVIPTTQRTHLAEMFVPDGEESSYPAIQGFLLDGSEVVMGIREVLGFIAKPLQD